MPRYMIPRTANCDGGALCRRTDLYRRFRWWEDQPARVRGRQLIADTEAWLHGGPALASETEAWLRDRTGADWR